MTTLYTIYFFPASFASLFLPSAKNSSAKELSHTRSAKDLSMTDFKNYSNSIKYEP